MKIIEMKLKGSLIEAVTEIQIDESDNVWVETLEVIIQNEFQNIQDIVSQSFPLNRVIVVPKGCKLKFDKPVKVAK